MSEATDPQQRAVRFYDNHPINEQQILHDLARDGVALDGLTEATLKKYDQDHFGGLEAVDILAAKAGIASQHHLLDVCSGMGGPARYLAHGIGCRVTGLDITLSRHEGAIRLTKLVGLEDRVDFRHGSALDMPFAAASFDAVISQEAWAHVPDKPRLIAEAGRVVKPGGVIAFTDIMRGEHLRPEAAERVQREMAFVGFESLAGYGALLEGAGCTVIEDEDLTGDWAEILRQRLTMYRGLRDTTIERFGAEHFRAWDDTYAFFVNLFAERQLAGGR
ncbi:MAG: methyltransferase domain-containing protein, partial [Pseudomonadota bacterium]